jgi:hypothetical protein
MARHARAILGWGVFYRERIVLEKGDVVIHLKPVDILNPRKMERVRRRLRVSEKRLKEVARLVQLSLGFKLPGEEALVYLC